jgi:hypothetical protein
MVWPACFDPHVAKLHQLACSAPRMSRNAHDNSWYVCVIRRLRMTLSVRLAILPIAVGEGTETITCEEQKNARALSFLVD